jgi:hypothetical protein
MNKTYYFFLF